MSNEVQLIVIDDDQIIRDSIAEALELDGYKVSCFESAEMALRRITPEFRGVVISDVRLQGMDGLALLEHLKAATKGVPVILMTGYGEVSLAVKAMRSGAYDFIEKPFAPELLIDVVRRAIEHCQLRVEVESLRQEVSHLHGVDAALLGCSAAIRRLRAQIANIADTSAEVLLFGETGTGKELVARALHNMSARKRSRFVALNCGGLPESLFESEIFGHEAGAFTGAAKRRIGRVEHADSGTLLLDEIETMPLPLQTKLLRVLQERRIERLGSNREIPVDFRLIAATKSDLKLLSQQGSFRSDLYYRLNVAVIQLPPLRERREDIPLLLTHFMMQASHRHGRPVPEISTAHMREMMLHNWPGNVRELRNAAERFVLGLMEFEQSELQDVNDNGSSLSDQLDQFECVLLQRELKRHKGCAQATMQALRLPKRTFYDKMNKHGIRPEVYRIASHHDAEAVSPA